MNISKNTNTHYARFVCAMLCFGALTGTAAGEGMSASEFARLMDGLHSEIKDVWFIFEGQVRGLSRARRPARPTSAHSSSRARTPTAPTGATLLDVYVHSARTDVPFQRTTLAQVKGKMEQVDRIPDSGIQPDPLVSTASPEALRPADVRPANLYLSYFRIGPGLAGEDFADEGWEDVAGHRCLRVQDQPVPGSGQEGSAAAAMSLNRLWIDMERGGHPLRDEFWRGRDLWSRTEIELEQFSGPNGGKRIWFPSRRESTIPS